MQDFITCTIDGSHSSFPNLRYDVIMTDYATNHRQLLCALMLGWGSKFRQTRKDSCKGLRPRHFLIQANQDSGGAMKYLCMSPLTSRYSNTYHCSRS
jgi:hypothetical protein